MKVSIALISTLLLLILKSTPLFAAPCDEALVRATLTSGKAVQKDWRIALMVTRGVYDEIKHSGGAGAEIGGVPLGANYEDFHNRVENLKNSTNESYAMSDIRNIAWSGLDPNAVNVYSKCLDAEVLQSNGLNAAILAGTNKEIAIRVHWFLPAEPKPAHVTWTPPSIEGTVIPQSIPQGYMTIIVPRPDTERLLSGNYRGYATAALSLQPPPGPPPPLPVAPPAQPKDPVGLYGFANAAYKDRDNELRSHCGDFTRKNAVGDFNELCSSVGRHCQWVCDWEGHAKACGENPNDGTRLAMCQ